MTTLIMPQETGRIVVTGWEIRGALHPTRIQQKKIQKLISENIFIPLRIRQELHEHMAVIVDKASKSLTFWTLSGTNSTYSDASFDGLEKVLVETIDIHTPRKIQIVTGHLGPVLVNEKIFDVKLLSF